MIYSAKDMETRAALDAAARMCAAARTAPKTKRHGDGLVTCVVTGEEKEQLADELRRLAGELQLAFFLRDADNVDVSQAVVLFGMQEQRRGNRSRLSVLSFRRLLATARNGTACARLTLSTSALPSVPPRPQPPTHGSTAA